MAFIQLESIRDDKWQGKILGIREVYLEQLFMVVFKNAEQGFLILHCDNTFMAGGNLRDRLLLLDHWSTIYQMTEDVKEMLPSTLKAKKYLPVDTNC